MQLSLISRHNNRTDYYKGGVNEMAAIKPITKPYNITSPAAVKRYMVMKANNDPSVKIVVRKKGVSNVETTRD